VRQSAVGQQVAKPDGSETAQETTARDGPLLLL
jgi:hypothetical protein